VKRSELRQRLEGLDTRGNPVDRALQDAIRFAGLAVLELAEAIKPPTLESHAFVPQPRATDLCAVCSKAAWECVNNA
jgi:hypothetical protein